MKITNSYSVDKKIQLVWWLIRTKVICVNARIFRFPFDLRGKKYIDFGKNITTGIGCRLEAFSENGNPTLIFGDRVQLNDYVHICAMKQVYIGNDVLIASKVYISDNSHGIYSGNGTHTNPELPPIKREYFISSVTIENCVWIGENVSILPGTHISKGSIIGANSVVKGIIPPYTIAVGSPARIVKRYDFSRKGWFKTDSQGNFLN